MLSFRLAASLRTGSFIARRSISYAAAPARASIRLRLLAGVSGAGAYAAWNLEEYDVMPFWRILGYWLHIRPTHKINPVRLVV
ncbi:hypothetical protein COOONC_16763 [Cooperia oncophora]